MLRSLPARPTSRLRLGGLAALCILCCCGLRCGVRPPQSAPAPQRLGDGETIVLIRHGEKPAGGLGQLTCTGLNRALALPGVLIPRFGTPAALFAPDPAFRVKDGDQFYSYVRPIATLEPTAIQLGLPVNTQIAYPDVEALARAVTAPAYAHSTVFIAWEHVQAENFARLMLRSYGGDPTQVHPWPGGDYDTIFVFHLDSPVGGAAGPIHFETEKEGLDGTLASLCPGQAPRPAG